MEEPIETFTLYSFHPNSLIVGGDFEEPWKLMCSSLVFVLDDPMRCRLVVHVRQPNDDKHQITDEDKLTRHID